MPWYIPPQTGKKESTCRFPKRKICLAGLSSGQPPDPCCQKRNSFSCRENDLYRYALQRTSVRRATGKRRFRGSLTPELPARWYRAVRTSRCDSHIYSQRSYFIKPDPQPVLQLRTDKEKYDRREKVNLTLQFTDIGEHPLEGRFFSLCYGQYDGSP